MNMCSIMEFLSELEQNNNQEWFHSHKAEYQEAKAAFESLVGELLLRLRVMDGSIPLAEPKELTFKLQRDTRFSRDKSPYNPSFRAHIAQKGKLPVPVGSFLYLQPGGRSFLGGGLFADMFKEASTMVRDRISAHGDEWERIVTDPEFTRYFTVGGTRLKKVPQGYDPGHPQAEYLKYKSWYLELPVSDGQVTADSFLDYAVGMYTRMQPFNSFLNKALEEFRMPSR